MHIMAAKKGRDVRNEAPRRLHASWRRELRELRPGNVEDTMTAKFWPGLIVLLLAALLLRAAPAIAETNIQEGLWEITIRMEVPGLPSNPAPVTSAHCLKDRSEVPQLLQKDSSCRITETKTAGESVSWKMKCEAGEGSIDGSGRMTYRGGRFDGVISLTMRRPDAGPLKIIQHVSGRRVGECP